MLPSWTVPKSRAMGARVRGDGVASPRRLMKSSAVLASEVISRALMRVVGGSEGAGDVVGCGVKVTMRMQLAEGSTVPQLLSTVKSGVVRRAVMWIGTVPVLLRMTVWGLSGVADLGGGEGEGAFGGGERDQRGSVGWGGGWCGGCGACEFDEVGAAERVAFDDEGAGVGGGLRGGGAGGEFG